MLITYEVLQRQDVGQSIATLGRTLEIITAAASTAVSNTASTVVSAVYFKWGAPQGTHLPIPLVLRVEKYHL